MASKTDSANDSVKSAVRTLDILETLVRLGRPMAAREISEILGIPVSSLSYLLTTLVNRDYLVRDGRLYHAGPAIGRLNRHSRPVPLADRVRPIVRSLRDQLNETASFFVLKDFAAEALVSEVGQHALRYSVEVGSRGPLHAFAAGKAMLATFDYVDLSIYFETVERERFTPRTIVDEGDLRCELDQIRLSDGVARTIEEHTPGIIGIGRAVTAHNGDLLGALSIAVPAARYDLKLDERILYLLEHAIDMVRKSQPE